LKVIPIYFIYFLKHTFYFILFLSPKTVFLQSLSIQPLTWALVEVVGQHQQSVSGWESSFLQGFKRWISDHLVVNSTVHAAMQFPLGLGKHINVKNKCFRSISDGCGLNNLVSNDELLRGLLLGHGQGAVCTVNGVHVVIALLVTIIAPYFLSS
jgi:hypothetical protein